MVPWRKKTNPACTLLPEHTNWCHSSARSITSHFHHSKTVLVKRVKGISSGRCLPTASTVHPVLFFAIFTAPASCWIQMLLLKLLRFIIISVKHQSWNSVLPSVLPAAHGIRADGDAKAADVGAAGVGSGGDCTGAAGPAGPGQPTGLQCMLLLLVLLL